MPQKPRKKIAKKTRRRPTTPKFEVPQNLQNITNVMPEILVEVQGFVEGHDSENAIPHTSERSALESIDGDSGYTGYMAVYTFSHYEKITQPGGVIREVVP